MVHSGSTGDLESFKQQRRYRPWVRPLIIPLFKPRNPDARVHVQLKRVRRINTTAQSLTTNEGNSSLEEESRLSGVDVARHSAKMERR